jgi:hypothetical protein
MNNHDNNNNNDSTIFPGTFTGTIDQLLLHCGNADADQVNNEIEEIEYDRVVESTMLEFGISRYDAESAIQAAKLQMIQNTLDTMMQQGLVKISGENDDGEPLYVQTELGKRLAKKSLQDKK